MAVLRAGQLTVPCSGILFDKDGTLMDLMSMWGVWAEIVLRGMEDQLQLIGAGLGGISPKLLGTRHDASGAVTGYDPNGPLPMATVEETHGILAWQLYAAGMPWNEAVARVMHLGKEAMNEVRRRREARPIAGLLPFLDRCRDAGLKLAVVTSDIAETTAEHLEWLGITDRFHAVVTRDMVTKGKPAPEMAETACRLLGLRPEETVVIGDSNGDMQMGKGAGVRLAVGLSAAAGDTGHLADADIVVPDYNDLILIP